MIRLFYRFLILLHPPQFRERFGPEMLSAFDDFSGGRESFPLVTDALFSIVRQWFVRDSLRIYAGAIAGGLLTLYIPFAAGRPPLTHVRTIYDPRQAVYLIYAVAAVQAIGLTMVFSVAFFRYTLRRRDA